jgi:DisA bacterial checkpoint controller nucleotide-binding
MTIAALKALCSRIPWCEPTVLESALELALEIAREGREGRRIGTLFTVGKADDVLAASRALILDPLTGHVPARTHISDPNLRGTMKELAQLDGAFVISETGIVVAACRYLDASVEQSDALCEHVRRLLVAYGRLPRRLSRKHGFLDSVGNKAHPGNERTCPQCCGLMEYRHRSPILSAVDPNSREPRERLRYVSGWFCSDPACDYQELAQPRG